MPEIIEEKHVFSLLEVAQSVQKTLRSRYTSTFWVKAEMNKLNYYSHSGHCYPELLEKKDGKITAQMRAHLWKDDYQRVNQKFITTLHEPLKDGIKILFQAKISFDPVHGISLWMIDIDPNFTLGDLEKEKREAIDQLKREGIYQKNKHCKIPLLPQRIAVISVETSKGYADFLKVLNENSWGYAFFYYLFPSLLQGDQAAGNIVEQLRQIKKVIHHFDVVTIIRGGGGDVGLSCYNNYSLAKEIADFPIPVLTGIGHATNETVAEMVSHTNAITPTKLAEFLIQKFHNFFVPIKDAQQIIIEKSTRLLSEQSSKFESEIKLFRSVSENILLSNRKEMIRWSQQLIQQAQYVFNREKEALQMQHSHLIKYAEQSIQCKRNDIQNSIVHVGKDAGNKIGLFSLTLHQKQQQIALFPAQMIKNKTVLMENMEKQIQIMDPINVLKRGYSMTKINGKSLSDIQGLKTGQELETHLANGKIYSTIIKTENESK